MVVIIPKFRTSTRHPKSAMFMSNIPILNGYFCFLKLNQHFDWLKTLDYSRTNRGTWSAATTWPRHRHLCVSLGRCPACSRGIILPFLEHQTGCSNQLVIPWLFERNWGSISKIGTPNFQSSIHPFHMKIQCWGIQYPPFLSPHLHAGTSYLSPVPVAASTSSSRSRALSIERTYLPEATAKWCADANWTCTCSTSAAPTPICTSATSWCLRARLPMASFCATSICWENLEHYLCFVVLNGFKV